MLPIQSESKHIKTMKRKLIVTGSLIHPFVAVKAIASWKAFNPSKSSRNYSTATLSPGWRQNIFWILGLRIFWMWLQNNTQKDRNIFSIWILICIIIMKRMRKSSLESQTGSSRMRFNKVGKCSYTHRCCKLVRSWHWDTWSEWRRYLSSKEWV